MDDNPTTPDNSTTDPATPALTKTPSLLGGSGSSPDPGGGEPDPGGTPDPGSTSTEGGEGSEGGESWISKFGLDQFQPDHPVLSRYESPEALVNAHLESRKLNSQKGLLPAHELQTPEEIDAFERAQGKPDSPDGYELPEIEGFELDEEDTTWLREASHTLGMTPREVQKSMHLQKASMERFAAKLQEQEETERIEAEKALRKDWGKEFDSRLKRTDQLLQRFGLSEALVKAGLGNNPDVIRAFDAMASAGLEDGAASGSRAAPRVSIEDRLKAHEDSMPPITDPKFEEWENTMNRLLREQVGLKP